MPEAAKAHTKAGAKAFAVYYWQVIDYATQVFDASPVAALSADDCAGCNAGITFLRAGQRRGARNVGGANTLRSIEATWHPIAGIRFCEVEFQLSNSAQTVTYPNGKVKHFPAGSVRERMLLDWADGSWVTKSLQVLE